jgi:hypothetical protein
MMHRIARPMHDPHALRLHRNDARIDHRRITPLTHVWNDLELAPASHGLEDFSAMRAEVSHAIFSGMTEYAAKNATPTISVVPRSL